MNRKHVILTLTALVFAGCSSMGHNKGTARAAQQLLTDDQNLLAQADANYKDAILKHGEGSDQATQAKTRPDNARTKNVAAQQHVEQWRRIQNAEPNPVESATQPSAIQATQGASGSS